MMPGVPPLPPQDEITTIFVVGFPDDMLEREFQNMFTFCPGFEAAALKIPSASEDESSKKQIIGFAKFRSLEEAMTARDVLNGRKIDYEKGCVIKAEMAKKNLHTRRGVSSQHDPTKFPYSSHFSNYRRRSAPDGAAFESQYYKGGAGFDYQNGYEFMGQYGDVYGQSNSTNYDGQGADVFDPFGPPYEGINNEGPNRFDPYYQNEFTPQQEEFEHQIPQIFGSHQSSRGFSSVLYNSDALLSRSVGSMSLNEYNTAETFGGRSGPLNYTTSTHTGGDQNPPCNTLYVGNLPNDDCEEELRILFQRCPGYKRLCFKSRSNGPMCFVEFESVHYATQALFQLYGNYLSNSTKGGIRLSYSKNPLGVRQQVPTIPLYPTDTKNLPDASDKLSKE